MPDKTRAPNAARQVLSGIFLLPFKMSKKPAQPDEAGKNCDIIHNKSAIIVDYILAWLIS